jgi:hypothetical protein
VTSSPATRLAAVFTQYTVEGRDAAWLADAFLAAIASARRVYLTRDPHPDADAVYCRIDGGPHGSAEVIVPHKQSLRALLTRLAWLHAAAHGTEALTFGGRLLFTWPTSDGPIHVDGTFANSPTVQHLTLTVSTPSRHQPAE